MDVATEVVEKQRILGSPLNVGTVFAGASPARTDRNHSAANSDVTDMELNRYVNARVRDFGGVIDASGVMYGLALTGEGRSEPSMILFTACGTLRGTTASLGLTLPPCLTVIGRGVA